MIMQMVESARKAKCPIVGIPQPGEHPFCLKRSLLVESLRGLKIIDAAIQLPLDPKGQRVLVVYASGPRVQAIRKFYPMRSWSPDTVRLPIAKWADSQRVKSKRPLLDKFGKHIARLEKQLTKLMRYKPLNPVTYRGWSSRYDYEEIGRWKRQKAWRVRVNRLAQKFYTHEITREQLEQALIQEGTSVWAWGLDASDYRQFYSVCNGFASKSKSYEHYQIEWGTGALQKFCQNADRAQRDMLRAEIASVRELQGGEHDGR